MTEWQIKKIFFTRKLFIVLISHRLRQMNTDDFLWGHGDKYSAHGCYFWTRINRIERIVPCGRHFHPSASNCCYCNRKSVKICAICGSINLKRYFLKNIIPTDEIVPTDELSSHRWIRLPQITRMNTDYFPCGGTRIISNTNKPNLTNFPSGSLFV